MNHEEPHSLGAMLSAARQERGLPLEQVARETRIRVQRLKEIEADDLSQFSHPSYARMFLADYARYLGIPMDKIQAYLPEWGECGTEGYQYLQETPVDSIKGIRRMPQRPRFRTLIVVGASLVLVSMGGFKIWKTMRDIERLNLGRVAQGDKSALTELPGEQMTPQVVAVEIVQTEVTEATSEIPDALNIPEMPEPDFTEAEAAGVLETDLTTFVPEAASKPVIPDFASEDKAVLFVGGAGDRVQ